MTDLVPSSDSKSVEGARVSGIRSLSNNFCGMTQYFECSDEQESLSAISDYDSRVWVGNYQVKASMSSTLQAILDKHGDIAANCQLESLPLRAHYLECVCFVVQELKPTSLSHLNKSKIKEMLAVLKDVESAQINVSWLRRVLDEVAEIIEPITQQQAIEDAKASTKKELESQIEDLAVKEKEVDIAKARIAETEACLNLIELESSQFMENVASVRSKVENFDIRSLLHEFLYSSNSALSN